MDTQESPYILTCAGRKFFFNDPDRGGFSIPEIAAPLSRLCRFTGHTNKFYSVAQHSVFVSHVVPPEFALEALLHDGSEAFITDISSPLKALLPEYMALEQKVQTAISDFFGVKAPPMSPEVRRGDLIALATEKRDLMPNDATPWPCLDGIEPVDAPLVPLTPNEAEFIFVHRYTELTQSV